MLKALLLCALLALLTLTPRAETEAAPAPRPIPWDCDTWAAFAHEDRTTQILESLAANRGKALYCGVDQSDTFTKAETWEAGRDRNERDDTVYFGEEGQFRGFIAAQEGYLTEGESGVTGVSIDRIFEFPREQETRRRVKVKTLDIEFSVSSCGEVETLPCDGGSSIGQPDQTSARNSYSEPGRTRALDWAQLANNDAHVGCQHLGYNRARNIVINETKTGYPGAPASFPAWEYGTDIYNNVVAWQRRVATATCVKKVRGARR